MKLVQLNIEREKHLERIIPFVKQENPDVFCVQELLERSIPRLREELNMTCVFIPNEKVPLDDGVFVQGLAIFSRHMINDYRVHYYKGDARTLPLGTHNIDSGNHLLLVADIEINGEVFRVGTTHFTWTPDGNPNDDQRRDLPKLLALLKAEEPLFFCGDLNAARGKEIFTEINKHYTDNIPVSYVTSLDLTYHRAAATDRECIATLMVDGLFSTPEYEAHHVRLQDGVSDHMAIVAEITQNLV